MGSVATNMDRASFGASRQALIGSAVGFASAAALVAAANQTSPLLALVAALGGLVSGVMLLSPSWAFIVVAAVIPIERIGRLTNDFDSYTISLSRVVGLIALGAFLLHACIRRWKLRFGTAMLLYAGYAVMGALSVTYADAPRDALRDEFRILGNLLFFFLVINLVRNFPLARAGVIAWLLVTMGTGIYSIYGYHFGSGSVVDEAEVGLLNQRGGTVMTDASEARALGGAVKRAIGTTSHPTLFGLNLVLSIPFFAYAIRISTLRWKLFWFAGFAIVCYNVLLTNTRAVLLLALLTLVYTTLRGLWALTPKAVFAVILIGAATLPFIPEQVYQRTLDPSLYSTAKSDSIRIRFKYWDKSWELIQDNWWRGIGVGNQTAIVQMVTDEAAGRVTPDGLKASAHNEYLQTMVEVGLFGWLLHFGFVGLATWYSFKAARIFRAFRETQEHYWFMIACQAAMLQILLFGIQVDVFHFGIKGWWLAAALSCVMMQLAREYVIQRRRDEAIALREKGESTL